MYVKASATAGPIAAEVMMRRAHCDQPIAARAAGSCLGHPAHTQSFVCSEHAATAAGMPAGVPDFNVLNLYDVKDKFSEGEEVSLETLKQKRIFNLSGREAKLPLKVPPSTSVSTHTAVTSCQTVSSSSTFRPNLT